MHATLGYNIIFFFFICMKTANVFFKASKYETYDYQYIKAHTLILAHKKATRTWLRFNFEVYKCHLQCCELEWSVPCSACTCKLEQDKKCTISTLEFMTCWWVGWFWDVEKKEGPSFNDQAVYLVIIFLIHHF